MNNPLEIMEVDHYRVCLPSEEGWEWYGAIPIFWRLRGGPFPSYKAARCDAEYQIRQTIIPVISKVASHAAKSFHSKQCDS